MAWRNGESRPVFWATLGCRVVGWLIVVLGATLLTFSLRDGFFLPAVVLLAGLIVTGLAYVAIGHKVARGRAWAGICGIVLSCLTLLFAGILVVGEAILVSELGAPSWTAARSSSSPAKGCSPSCWSGWSGNSGGRCG